MARIMCGVDQCSHNKTGVCYSNFVSIEGSSAKEDCDTSCSSFLDKASYSELTSNVMSGGSACECLGCKVETCKHNNDCKCNLDSIKVDGANANYYSETSCYSFDPQ